jgi:undecaprenyl pyrophosphate synthase
MPFCKKDACDGKVMWETRKEANHVAKLRQKRKRVPMNCYKCKWCVGWHIGHRTVYLHNYDNWDAEESQEVLEEEDGI